MKVKAGPEPEGHGVWQYTLVCLLAALALAAALLARGLGAAALFPLLFALFLPLLRWRAGPWVLLGAIGWTIFADRLGVDPFALLGRVLTSFISLLASVRPHWPYRGDHPPRFRDPRPALDLVLCGALLVWIAAYCRLLSVTWTIFPPDKRRRAIPRKTPAVTLDLGQRRSALLTDGEELARLLMGAALVAVAAQMLGEMVTKPERTAREDLASSLPSSVDVNLPDGLWRMILLLWLFAVVLIVATGILSYLGQRRMTSAESALYLQDQLWRQLRREQARLNRWLAWAEKRAARRQAKGEPGRVSTGRKESQP